MVFIHQKKETKMEMYMTACASRVALNTISLMPARENVMDHVFRSYCSSIDPLSRSSQRRCHQIRSGRAFDRLATSRLTHSQQSHWTKPSSMRER